MRLTNKVVLITGATRGIGLSLVHQMLSYDVDLILPVLDPRHMSSLLVGKEIAGSCRIVKMDLRDHESIEHGLHELGEDLERIDILINNAGQLSGGILEEQEIGPIYDMFHVNLVAPVHLTRRVLPHMLQKSEAMVVNNTSINGILNRPGDTSYCATKAGLIGFSESLRRELSGTGVRVLTLITPAVDTQMFQSSIEISHPHIDVRRWRAMPPESWAGRVIEAIENNSKYLYPRGIERVLLLVARHFPALYDLYCRRRFFRDGRFAELSVP